MKPEEILKEAYDPERFRQAGHRLVDELADHLATTLKGEGPAVLPWQTPEQAYERVQKLADTDAETVFSATLAHSIRLHHPHCAGHQITPPVPVAALAGLLSDMVNNGMGVYEVGLGGVFCRSDVTISVCVCVWRAAQCLTERVQQLERGPRSSPKWGITNDQTGKQLHDIGRVVILMLL